MKSKSVIFIGIIVAIICCTQFSGFTEKLVNQEKQSVIYRNNHHAKQLNIDRRFPLKHIVYHVTKKIKLNL